MHDGNRLEAEAEDFEGRAIDEVHVELRDVGAAVFHFEGVGENAMDGGEGIGSGVDGDGALPVVEGTHVVQTEDVIGVAVGVEDGVEPFDSRGKHLGAEKSGVVSMRILRSTPPESGWRIRMDGRRRVSRGSVEWQTAQEQPMVATPELVPEPRTLMERDI